jgi:predicted acylesterase/phospholipase RssA
VRLDVSHIDREHAAKLLKQRPLFRNLSRRLLIDVVDQSLAGRMRDSGAALLQSYVGEEIPPPKGIEGPTTIVGQILAFIVLKGTLIVASAPHKGAPPRPPLPSPLPPDLPAGVDFAFEFTPGAYDRNIDPHLAPFGAFRLEPPKDQEVSLLVVSTGAVSAPSVAWGLNTKAISDDELLKVVVGLRRPELIWIAAPNGTVPAEPLTHALAGNIAQTYPAEGAALVSLGSAPEVLQWIGDRFDDLKKPLPKNGITTDNLFDLVGGKDRRGRVWVLNRADTLNRPARLYEDVYFDRVIYLTDEIPPSLPTNIGNLLSPGILTGKQDGAFFSSFIPSTSSGFATLKGANAKQFKAGSFVQKKKGGNTPGDDAMIAFMRCMRDSSVVPLDLDLLSHTWETWMAGGGPGLATPFVTVAVDSGAISGTVLSHWGRAVTNRRVGVACSGGGASAYRIGPVLKRIEQQGIPVDVYTGLSGSALIGSFYSLSGMAGFDFARRLAPFFQLTLPLVTLWTTPWEWVMDFFLDGARVEDLVMRFAAVAAALPDSERPSVTVVVNGTLGEAVRVSGSLPPSFAPSDKNGVRYTDGGGGTAVPAQVARDCGADVVLACNVIPGPALGNPFSAIPPLGWLVRRTPFVGRMVDNYTWYAFLMQEMSRAFGESADVFVEFKEQDFPLLESTAFIAADCIIAEAEKEKDYLDQQVDALLKAWQAL